MGYRWMVRFLENPESPYVVSEAELYSHGNCHLMAIALREAARHTRPILCLLDDEPEFGTCLVHAGLSVGAQLLDVNGLRNLNAVVAEYEAWSPYWAILNESELLELATGSAVHSPDVAQGLRDARPFAAKLWKQFSNSD